MAAIRPFRAVRYRVADVSLVISQPYDRIDRLLQEQYYAVSPYNVVRIDRGKELPTDVPDRAHGPNAYTRARAYYDLWQVEGALVRDSEPGLYVYHQTFALGGETRTRRAFIAAFELSTLDQGVVLPHERTFAAPKEDRLRLLRTLEVNTGLIFLLYPDPRNQVTGLLDAAIRGRQPDVEAVDLHERDVRQQLWAVTDSATIHAVQEAMAPKRNLVIADGHHRYETALNYRDEVRARCPAAPPEAASNYCCASLVSLGDPGLVILPTHRELYGYEGMSRADLLARAATAFEAIPVADQEACLAQMRVSAARHTFGFYADRQYAVLVLRSPAAIERWMPGERSMAWRSLDVSILHGVLLEGILGLAPGAADARSGVRYHRDLASAIESVDSGDGYCAFLMNPTPIDQVKACAEGGDRMPHKSTDFYPKMISGLTMMPVGDMERI